MLSSNTFWLLVAPALVSALPNAAVTSCLSSSNVPQVLTTDSKYSLVVKPFNLRLPFTPVAIAMPSTTAQVQAAVACGASLNVTVTPRSGGHSYASHGLGGENGHLMVDMKLFKNVTVDSATGIATVGVGGRLGNIAQSVYSQGQRAFSHGTCPGVGVGGHVVGGGYGYSSHTKGLALDNLVQATIVLANSSIVNASLTENPDLFWATMLTSHPNSHPWRRRSYGIITQYKFQTYAAPTSNVVFQYNLGSDGGSMKTAHAAFQDYANSTAMPAEMNARIFISPGGVQLEGVYIGSQSAFQSAIQPLLNKVGNPSGQVSTKGYIDALSNYAYMSLTTPLDYDIFSKSLMTVWLTDEALTNFWSYYQNTARSTNRDWYLIIDAHGGPTSAISKVAPNATSYAHRNALLKYEFYDRVNSGSYPSNGFGFLNGWVAAITDTMKTTTFGMYINYADPSLSATQAQNAYWLNHLSTLATIKKEVDPKNLFSNPQAIGLNEVVVRGRTRSLDIVSEEASSPYFTDNAAAVARRYRSIQSLKFSLETKEKHGRTGTRGLPITQSSHKATRHLIPRAEKLPRPSALDMKQGNTKPMQGYKKLQMSANVAKSEGYNYIWIDTCCIDKSSSTELSEAINSMFQWYKDSAICYAFLSDVDKNDGTKISQSRWFTRGWTLKELKAPGEIIFFASDWEPLGSKSDFRVQRIIEKRTRIPKSILQREHLTTVAAARRMSWAATRVTTRPEDIAYCLVGIFDGNMPLLYGEGKVKAFTRLQEEFLRISDDESIFAWQTTEVEAKNKPHWGILATDLVFFEQMSGTMRHTGIRIEPSLAPFHLDESQTIYLGFLNSTRLISNLPTLYAIILQRVSDIEEEFTRVSPDLLVEMSGGNLWNIPLKSLIQSFRDRYDRMGYKRKRRRRGPEPCAGLNISEPDPRVIFVRSNLQEANTMRGVLIHCTQNNLKADSARSPQAHVIKSFGSRFRNISFKGETKGRLISEELNSIHRVKFASFSPSSILDEFGASNLQHMHRKALCWLKINIVQSGLWPDPYSFIATEPDDNEDAIRVLLSRFGTGGGN
ncbi:hypothetical protein G7Y89_g2458 [Cudoniella acicularis]|uniref:FAD-binding PCMH-type domain-containing protein n=1 Tax=Cudoniella acicularis TaxID=354080 RepID=A0A8H4W9C2_9HELO|nr:hypothetical protein G7Y89_g2458 [Cudoniella acicularis]